MNKRKYSRVVFETTAKIKKDSSFVKGEVENLSLKGAYIETLPVNNINIEDLVEIYIELTGTTSNLNLKVNARIKRKDKKGYGVEFTSVDLDTFTYLKNIVAYNSGEYENILEEFENSSKN